MIPTGSVGKISPFFTQKKKEINLFHQQHDDDDEIQENKK